MSAKSTALVIAPAVIGVALWRTTTIEIMPAAGLLASVVLLFEARTKRRLTAQAARVAAWPGLIEYFVSALESGLPLFDAVAEGVDYFAGETRGLLMALRMRTMQGATVAEAFAAETSWHSFAPYVELTIQLQAFEYTGAPGLAADLRSAATRYRAETALEAELSSRLNWLMTTVRMSIVAPWLMVAVLSQRIEARAAYQSPLGAALLWCGLVLCGFAYLIIKRQKNAAPPVSHFWRLA